MSLLSAITPSVDGRNPANQLRLVAYPIIYKALYIPGILSDFFHHQNHSSLFFGRANTSLIKAGF